MQTLVFCKLIFLGLARMIAIVLTISITSRILLPTVLFEALELSLYIYCPSVPSCPSRRRHRPLSVRPVVRPVAVVRALSVRPVLFVPSSPSSSSVRSSRRAFRRHRPPSVRPSLCPSRRVPVRPVVRPS